MASLSIVVILFIFCSLLPLSLSDTPANCSYEDIQGKWLFKVGKGDQDNTIDCSELGPVESEVTIDLQERDVAVDQFGNKGFWTLIYNQGFEVVVRGRKYFAFSKYTGKGSHAISYCNTTLPGWSHDVLGRDWACYQGQKVTEVKPKVTYAKQYDSTQQYRHNPDFISSINSAQSTWKAAHYPEYDHMTLAAMTRRAGGTKSRVYGGVKPAPPSAEQKKQASDLPEAWDWRNVDGVNYVSPVRNQGACGSCYGFSSMGQLEARVRVFTNNTDKPVLSPQDIVECSEYSQGCDGGFPFLIAGKYAEDFGVVTEDCNPYKGRDGKCSTHKSCERHYATRYKYLGGYYGACNEEAMKIALVNNGPLSVSFQVYNDFMNYKSGIYQHTGLEDKFNPFELTNHAVLLVGYGIAHDSGVKYWIVKNSWGESWGEEGYFKIVRGVDECAIESIAVETFPIF